MLGYTFFCLFVVSLVCGYPQEYLTKHFKVGIEYEGSLPMSGASDRLKHRNNYDPFFVAITATAKNGYVISYIEVSATVVLDGVVDFTVVRGRTGDTSMVLQLVSNQSDFLTYSYLAYGIREEEYKKVANIVTIPMRNASKRLLYNNYLISLSILFIYGIKYIIL